MSEFADVLRRENPAIDAIIAGAGDIVATNKYRDIDAMLNQMQQQRGDILRRQNLEMKYQNGINMLKNSPDMLYNTAYQVDKYNPNLEGTDAFARYNFYKKQMAENNAGMPKSFEDFVAGDEPSKIELLNKGLASQTKNVIGDDEIKNLIYKQGGFTPEEIDWYNNKTKDLKDRKQFNQELMDMVTRNQAILTSKGEVGKRYFDALKNRAANMEIVPEKGEFKFEKIGDDLYRFDAFGGFEKVVTGTPKLTPMTEIKTRVVKNDDGTYSFKVPMKNDKGDVQFKMVPGATENDFNIQEAEDVNKATDFFEKRDYMQGQKIEFKTMFPSLGKKGSKGSQKTQLDDVEKKQLSDIKSWGLTGRNWALMNDSEKKKYTDREQELAKLYFNSDVKKLQEVKESIIKSKGKNSDEKAFLDYLNSREDGTDGQQTPLSGFPVMNPPKNTAPVTNEKNQKIQKIYKDEAEKRKQQYISELKNSGKFNDGQFTAVKKATEKIFNRFNDIIGNWGRTDLTPKQWREEFLKVNWNQTEYEILKQMFKNSFGQDL